ncbi:MAG: 2-oxo-4-hydroxy-4-carboxy-5-ureidoimidazoline decarboxylase [Tessaracoccus sp.]|nr:2-oxo-4-hydroxy-4-carboxy-5-ureidoimidazoline decarboxylase [Tessaracoccus sp.]
MRAMNLDDFNRAGKAEAARAALVWAAIPSWAEALAAGRPYATVEEAAREAEQASAAWTPADLDDAVAHHPRIGQRPHGDEPEVHVSRREQAAMRTASEELAVAMAEASALYESRFGRVFLIRAAGRTPAEMLAEVHRRLHNDDETEAEEAIGQLRQIAVRRLRGDLG